MHFLTNIFPYVLILRPGIFVGVFILVIFSTISANSFGLPIIKVFAGALAVAFAAGAGSLVNDIYDLRGDMLNNPGRVLPSGRLGIRRAWSYYFVLLIISFGLFWIAGVPSFLVGVTLTILLFFYSWKLREINGLLSNLVIALSVALALAFGIFLTGQITMPVILLFGFGFSIVFAREILGDVVGLKGDEVQGLNTFPIVFGSDAALRLVSIILFAVAVFSYTPFVMTGIFENMWAGFISSTMLMFVLIYVLRKIREDDIDAARKILKGMLFVYPSFVVLGVKIPQYFSLG